MAIHSSRFPRIDVNAHVRLHAASLKRNVRPQEVSPIVYWGYIGITENKMETTIVYWGYIGIMEKKMETTTCIGIILGLYGACPFWLAGCQVSEACLC